MKKTKQFRPTAFILNAKMKVSLMLLLMLMLVSQGAWALGGSGSSSSPYTIANASDLKEFADIVNGTNGKTRNVAACGKLTADITLTSTWTAMGSSSYAYTGTFDGQGHKISGFSMEGYTKVNAGFFGYVNGATIKNFTLNGTMTSSTQITSGENDCSGAVVGRAMGSSTIQDIVSNVNITLTKAQKHLGGVVGAIEGSTVVKGCTYTGTLDAGPSTDCIGGIVGFAPASCSGSIFYCFFNGTLSSSSSTPTMGGILGYTNDESNNFSGVHDCYSCGTFSFGASDYKYVNAIVGRIRNRATTTINNTYLSGKATRACNTDGPSIPTSNKAITISVKANNNTYGTVSQSYVNPTRTTATQLQVVATPNDHYYFKSWSDSKAQTHNVDLTADVSLTATFVHNPIITVETNNSDYGTVSGGGEYTYNSQQTIKATPKTGYKFVQWNDGNTSASRTITVTEDKTYTATFAIDQFTITVKTNDSSMGTVSGGGTFDYGTTNVRISATPKTHYHFVQWNDGNTNASRSITVTEDKTYTATFAIDQFTITVNVANGQTDMGTVSGGGTFDYNSTKTITATPKAHYHFVKWNDGNTSTSRTITVTEDKTYTATFAIDQFTITVKTNDSSMGTVSGGGTFDYGSTKTIKATPKTGYHFDKWSDGNTSASRTITVNGNATYTATFAAHTFADDDLAQGVCTTCHHGFFRYTSKDNVVVTPYNYAALTDAEGNQLTHISNTNVDGKGVIEFNKPLANIVSYAFSRKTDLTGMTIPNSVTVIGNAAFAGCTGFTGDLVIPESVTSIGASAFNGCGFTGDLVILTSVTSIGNSAFSGCSFSGNLVIPTSVTSIGNSAFSGCSFSGNLVIPESVTSIGYYAFQGCTGFKSVEFNSIPRVWDLAFSGVTDNVTLTLTDNSYIYTDGTNYLPAVTSATFNREIVADGGMYSFFVPFDIPAAQAAELGKFYQYSGHDPEERMVYFDDIAEVSDGVVKANTAYFFKPAKDITSFTVNNPSIPRTLTIRDPENPSVPGLYGTYSEIAVPQGAYGYAMLDGQSTFVKAGYGNALWPYRAYLWLGSGAYMVKAHAIRGQQKGDVNGDGKISLADLTLLVEILNGDATDTTGAADIDGKNGVTIDDLKILRNHILGLLNIEDLYPEYDGQTPGYQTPSGYRINYDDEDGDEGVPTIQNCIWDR